MLQRLLALDVPPVSSIHTVSHTFDIFCSKRPPTTASWHPCCTRSPQPFLFLIRCSFSFISSILRSHGHSIPAILPVAMPERLYASPSDATTPMAMEPSPFASSADIPSGPAGWLLLAWEPASLPSTVRYSSARALATFLDDCHPQHHCHRHSKPPIGH